MCCPPTDYIMFSLKKLKFYGVWGPEAGGWIIQTPCLRNVFILYISRSSTFLRSNLNICIVYQSFRTILLLNTSEVSNFTENTCARVSFFSIKLQAEAQVFSCEFWEIFRTPFSIEHLQWLLLFFH